MKRLSVKLRMTLWFTLLMLVLVSAVLMFLFSVGKNVMTTATKNDLMATVEKSRSDIEYEYGILDFDDDLKYFSNGVSLSVYNDAHQLLYGRQPNGYSPQDIPLLHNVIRDEGEESKRVYIFDMRYQQEGYGAIWIRGVLPTSGNNTAFSTLMNLAFVVLPALVVLASLTGYLLMARAFSPVERITQMANTIRADGDLTRRIALGKGQDEIYTLAESFDALFDTLQTAFEKERQFTLDASHELRTPVSVIVSQCEYGLEHAKGDKQWREIIKIVLEYAQRISSLITQLLAFARADQGKEQIHTERLNFSELAESVLETIKELANQKQIKVRSDIDANLYVRGDETLLIQLLWNLLENGVKYGKQSGCLRLILRQKGDNLVCQIIDDGIGIAPESAKKIWDRFYQVDPARAVDNHGFGLGLPMIKHIVQVHRGEISMDSILGHGSTFKFILPIEPSDSKKTFL